MKVGHGVPLSGEDRGNGRWFLRWYQNEKQADGSVKRMRRGHMTFTLDERREAETEIERDLREFGHWRNLGKKRAGARPAAGNAEEMAQEWIEIAKVGTDGVAPNTRKNLAQSMKRWFAAARSALELSVDDVVGIDAIDMALVQLVTAKLTDEYGAGTTYQTVAAFLEMWSWAGDMHDDDPDRFGALRSPPRNLSRLYPPAPQYEAPPAPLWKDVDAAVRRIGVRKRGERPMDALRLAILQRYTGLRLEQVAVAYREDFNLSDMNDPAFTVRKGKSRAENSVMRVIPVSGHLIRDLGDWLINHPGGPLFPDVERDNQGELQAIRSYRNQTRYITAAWKAATADGDVRRDLWAPSNRSKNRPDHAFRACIQEELTYLGVPERYIDRLVGHKAKGMRAKHYAPGREAEFRRFVDMIPPIEWTGTPKVADNVVKLPVRSAK